VQGVSRQVPRGDAPLSRRPRASTLVWDLPTRLVHWLLAALIAFSWWSVTYHHTDWHIWSGIAILTLLIFRLLWGFVGSSTARFATFIRGPRGIADYLGGRWSGIGHNPLGAVSVMALLAVTAVQVGLGLVAQDEDGIYAGPLSRLVSSDASDRARAIHEWWFYVLLGFIVLHVAAVVFYRVVRGKRLTKPMITGRAETETATIPSKWWVAVICLVVALAISRWVVAGAPPFGS
jgi:cytochrome b